MAPALECSDVSKRFGAVVALTGASLRVGAAEIHALMGANGSGKSTLCKIVAGTVRRDAGAVRIEAAEAALDSPREAAQRGVALFYQELSLVPQLSVADNIFLGHERRGPLGFLSGGQLAKDAAALIARFASVAGEGLTPDAQVGRLSPDQRQIVEILKVLARKPRLIIFDEATAALDRRQVEVLFVMMRELKADGVASIFISHRLDEVFAIADRITVMRNGETVASYATAEVDRERVVHDMVGSVDALAEPAPRFEPMLAGGPPLLSVQDARSARLHGVSLTLRAGEIVGLGGLQGQGQSSLLQGLFGARPLTAGAIEVGERQVSIRTPAQAMREGLAYVSGDRGREAALHGRSIFENLAAATLVKERLAFVRPGALKPRLREAVEALNTKYPGFDAPIGALSGGNQQKIFIARWLATKSPVLLLDDPTKGVDLGAKADFFTLVRGLAAEGAAILFYSSEDAELLGLCHRILVFNGGGVSGELSGSRLTPFHLTNASFGEAA